MVLLARSSCSFQLFIESRISAQTKCRPVGQGPSSVLGEPLAGHTGSVWSVAFSPDGARIASGSHDSTVRVWDTATGQQVGEPLAGHTGSVWSVAFSPDGTRIASGSHDRTVRVWDTATGQQVGEPLAEIQVVQAAWTPLKPIVPSADVNYVCNNLELHVVPRVAVGAFSFAPATQMSRSDAQYDWCTCSLCRRVHPDGTQQRKGTIRTHKATDARISLNSGSTPTPISLAQPGAVATDIAASRPSSPAPPLPDNDSDDDPPPFEPLSRLSADLDSDFAWPAENSGPPDTAFQFSSDEEDSNLAQYDGRSDVLDDDPPPDENLEVDVEDIASDPLFRSRASLLDEVQRTQIADDEEESIPAAPSPHPRPGRCCRENQRRCVCRRARTQQTRPNLCGRPMHRVHEEFMQYEISKTQGNEELY
ncbi:hypothetical protein B0H14DRAFT_3648960 [Mycena olivaceomarginata]|nr:hypothetical protein B0H14DRAFT_3648960 [Mycena olivaceomarginata]